MMLQTIMENYLNNKTVEVYPVNKDSSLPVTASKSEWVTLDKKLQKVFKFDKRKQKEAFVIEILKYCRESECIIEFRVKRNNVAIILHSSSPTISEIETEAKVDIDKIRKDVVYYFARKS